MATISDVSIEDQFALHAALLQWKNEGVVNPLIPFDLDLDGDGITDSFGLNENEELVIVSGVKVEDTVYESTGDGGLV